MDRYDETDEHKTFEGENGKYEIMMPNESAEIPKIRVKLENRIIIEKDMEKFFSDLLIKYPPEANREFELPYEEMNIIVEDENISILFVISDISVSFGEGKNERDYYIDFHNIYIKEK